MSTVVNLSNIGHTTASGYGLRLQISSISIFRARWYGMMYDIEPGLKLVTKVAVGDCYFYTDKCGQKSIALPFSSVLASELRKIEDVCLQDLRRIDAARTEANVTIHRDNILSLSIDSHLMDDDVPPSR